jgi:hypothetical protein
LLNAQYPTSLPLASQCAKYTNVFHLQVVIDSVYSEGSVFADVGVMMFQAGTTDRDQQLEEFGVFGNLRCGYICLDVAGDNHHKIRGRRIRFHRTLTRSFHIVLLYV